MGYLGPSLRRGKRIERPLKRTVLAILASIALNAALFLVLAEAGVFRLSAPADQTRVALAPLSSSQWAANRAIGKALPSPSQPPAPPPLPQAAPPPPEDKATGHVVELNPDQKAADKPPPDSKFLSDRNARVDKETVSRYAGNYPRVAPKPEAGAQGKAPQQRPPPKPPAPKDVTPGGKDQGAPGKEGAPGDRVALAAPHGEQSARQPTLGEGGQQGRPGEASQPDLSVSQEALERIAGGPNMDGVHEGLPEGEATWMNAREFKYATFMNRMKNDIAQQWIPRVQDASHKRDPDGSVYFYRERTVVLALVLDPNGNVKDVTVTQSSNVEFFDRIAMSSVKAAQPFPNPPSGMFHGEEQVSIPFSFTLYPGDRRGLLFWRPPAQ